jgi:hypothetical protein
LTFGIGAVVDLVLVEREAATLVIRLEPMVLGKGCTNKLIAGDGTSSWWKLTRVEIPILFRPGLGSADKLQSYILVGPSVGFLLSAKARINAPGEADIEVNDKFKRVDFSLAFGAGLNIPVGTNAFFIESSACLPIF